MDQRKSPDGSSRSAGALARADGTLDFTRHSTGADRGHGVHVDRYGRRGGRRTAAAGTRTAAGASRSRGSGAGRWAMSGTTHASVEHVQPPAPVSGPPGAVPSGSAPGWHPDNVLTVLAAGAVAVAVWPVLLALHGPQPL